METYYVTLTVRADSHPEKWIYEAVAHVLNSHLGEGILDYDVVTREEEDSTYLEWNE